MTWLLGEGIHFRCSDGDRVTVFSSCCQFFSVLSSLPFGLGPLDVLNGMVLSTIMTPDFCFFGVHANNFHCSLNEQAIWQW